MWSERILSFSFRTPCHNRHNQPIDYTQITAGKQKTASNQKTACYQMTADNQATEGTSSTFMAGSKSCDNKFADIIAALAVWL